MFQRTLVKDDQVQPLADAVCQVLAKVGVYCQNRDILEALEAAGAVANYDDQVVRFPEKMTSDFVERLASGGCEPAVNPRQPGADTPGSPQPRFNPPPVPGVGTQIAQLYYDYRTQKCHRGNRAGLLEAVKLGAMLGHAGHAVLMTDVPPLVEPMEAGLVLAEYAPDATPPFVWDVRQVDYLVEMGDILGKPNWFSWGAICFAHPLRFDKDVADKFVRRVRQGGSAGLTAMPVAGMTTPASISGFIAVAGAEVVATWMAGRALNAQAPLYASIWGGALDMRTATVSYCTFDAMAYAFALAEFLRRWTGLDTPVGGGEYCDAKEPGYYAAMEKAHKAMTIAAFSGRSPSIGQGLLEEGRTFCPVQLMLERELTEGLGFLGREFDVTPEELCLDDIVDVGHGLDRSFLNTKHTLSRFRDHLWCPKWMDRDGWRGAETDRTVLDRYQDQVDGLLADYRKPDVDPDALARCASVVDRAKRDLLD